MKIENMDCDKELEIQKRRKLGDLLRKSREDKEITQVMCALYCGVSVVTYQNWERGLSMPKEDNLKRICHFLEIEEE